MLRETSHSKNQVYLLFVKKRQQISHDFCCPFPFMAISFKLKYSETPFCHFNKPSKSSRLLFQG